MTKAMLVPHTFFPPQHLVQSLLGCGRHALITRDALGVHNSSLLSNGDPFLQVLSMSECMKSVSTVIVMNYLLCCIYIAVIDRQA